MITQIKVREHRLIKPITLIGCLLLAVVFILGLVGTVYAEEKPKTEIKKVETKVVSGEIISFSPMKNPKFIGIACEGEGGGYDAFFEIDKDVRIAHKRGLDEIKLGDRISITYEEATQVTEAGKEEVKRVAKVIKFVGPATRKLRREPGETKEPEESFELEILRSSE